MDPRGHVTVQITVDGIDVSKFMVHHQHAIMRPIISKEKVCFAEVVECGKSLKTLGTFTLGEINSISDTPVS